MMRAFRFISKEYRLSSLFIQQVVYRQIYSLCLGGLLSFKLPKPESYPAFTELLVSYFVKVKDVFLWHRALPHLRLGQGEPAVQ